MSCLQNVADLSWALSPLVNGAMTRWCLAQFWVPDGLPHAVRVIIQVWNEHFRLQGQDLTIAAWKESDVFKVSTGAASCQLWGLALPLRAQCSSHNQF